MYGGTQKRGLTTACLKKQSYSLRITNPCALMVKLLSCITQRPSRNTSINIPLGQFPSIAAVSNDLKKNCLKNFDRVAIFFRDKANIRRKILGRLSTWERRKIFELGCCPFAPKVHT